MVNQKLKLYVSFWVKYIIFYVSFCLQKLFHTVKFGIKGVFVKKLVFSVTFWMQKLTFLSVSGFRNGQTM